MSRIEGDTFIIEREKDSVCELCKAVEETRPYGPNGEQICFSCGEKNPKATMSKFLERINFTKNTKLGAI